MSKCLPGSAHLQLLHKGDEYWRSLRFRSPPYTGLRDFPVFCPSGPTVYPLAVFLLLRNRHTAGAHSTQVISNVTDRPYKPMPGGACGIDVEATANRLRANVCKTFDKDGHPIGNTRRSRRW